MALAVQALDSSFKRIIPQKLAFAEVFYTQLFQHFPETKLLFERRKTDMVGQQKALMQALELVIDSLREGQTNTLTTVLAELGMQHRTYGVQVADYQKVGGVLLDTLEQFDPEWSSQLRDDWSVAYTAVVSMMETTTAA